jgi:hypothetical protein
LEDSGFGGDDAGVIGRRFGRGWFDHLPVVDVQVAHDIQKFQAVARPQGSLICKGEAACRPASIASTRAGQAAGVPGQTASQLMALPARIESAFPRERAIARQHRLHCRSKNFAQFELSRF